MTKWKFLPKGDFWHKGDFLKEGRFLTKGKFKRRDFCYKGDFCWMGDFLLDGEKFYLLQDFLFSKSRHFRQFDKKDTLSSLRSARVNSRLKKIQFFIFVQFVQFWILINFQHFPIFHFCFLVHCAYNPDAPKYSQLNN